MVAMAYIKNRNLVAFEVLFLLKLKYGNMIMQFNELIFCRRMTRKFLIWRFRTSKKQWNSLPELNKMASYTSRWTSGM